MPKSTKTKLTSRQLDALRFINNEIKGNGQAPTFDELAEGLGLKSTWPAYRLATKLYEAGFITWKTRVPRSIRILRLPQELRPAA